MGNTQHPHGPPEVLSSHAAGSERGAVRHLWKFVDGQTFLSLRSASRAAFLLRPFSTPAAEAKKPHLKQQQVSSPGNGSKAVI